VDLYYLRSSRASKGILLLCIQRVVERVVECVGLFTVTCSVRNVAYNFELAFAAVLWTQCRL
jgi:hypothetical protein